MDLEKTQESLLQEISQAEAECAKIQPIFQQKQTEEGSVKQKFVPSFMKISKFVVAVEDTIIINANYCCICSWSPASL